ncbi:MAG: NUDIX hydrolase [Candidatus Aenigmatarchaeota archaeon]
MKTELVVGGFLIHNNKILLIHHRKLDKWLPPGGHINENETPDEALEREFAEELNLKIEILNKVAVASEGNIKKQLAVPFYVNVHSVGDHDHCCLFYLCRPINQEQLEVNKSELKDFMWVSSEELDQKHISTDVKHIAVKAFELFNSGKIKI